MQTKLRKYIQIVLITLPFIFTFSIKKVNAQASDPELIITRLDSVICEGDTAIVTIVIQNGSTPIYMAYTFDGDTIEKFSTKLSFDLLLTEPGEYHIIKYNDAVTPMIYTDIPFTIELFPPPQVYFTGGGLICSGETIQPLTAHFDGVPPFTLAFLLNDQPDTLFVNGYSYIFNISGPISIVTQSLADDNCRTDVIVDAEMNLIDITQPPIFGDTVFCEMDQTEYNTDRNDLSAEWQISEGADYIEGFGEEGSYIQVTWTDAGTHEVRLRIVDTESGCTSLWSDLEVFVNERPADLARIDTMFCFEEGGELIIEIPSETGVTIAWSDPGLSGSLIELQSEGSYAYIRTNQYNCADTGVVAVHSNCNIDVFVPEAFTPNGDGINDLLVIFGIYSEIEFSVYSPSGLLLYRVSGRNLTWDGTSNGQALPNGSYYWNVSYNGVNGISRHKSGVVTIIR